MPKPHNLTKGNIMSNELEKIIKASDAKVAELEMQIAELRGARTLLRLDREFENWSMETFIEECKKERVA